MPINFKAINFHINAGYAESFISTFLPHGSYGTGSGGRYFSTKDPVTGEKEPSLTVWVDGGNFRNHATGSTGGDFIALHSYLNGMGMGDAAKNLAEWSNYDMPTDIAHNDHYEQYSPATKKNGSAGRKVHVHPPLRGYLKSMSGFCDPTTIWTYHDTQNLPVAMVYRFDTQDGKKEFKQLRKIEGGWIWGGMTGKRPLYNLPEILARPNADVVIHEGEKPADAAKKLFPDKVQTTTMQGAASPAKTDFTHLAERNVYIFPDNDDPGKKYTAQVIGLLKKHKAKSIFVLKIPTDWLNKCDAADVIDQDPNVFVWESIEVFDKQNANNDEVNDFVYQGDHLYYMRYLQNSVKEELVYPGRITVIKEGTDINSDKTHLTISFDTPTGTKTSTLPQEEVATKRGILKLAGLGAPLSESRALLLSQYLIDLNNIKNIERVRQTSLLGRVEDGIVLPQGTANTNIQYQGNLNPSVGENKKIYSEVLKTILTTWGIDSWPLVMQIGFSLAAPLMDFASLKRNPCLVFVGPSGYGKTTVAKFCVGFWGNAETAPFKVEGSTSNTQIGIDQNIAKLISMPCLVDEIHKFAVKPTGKEVNFDRLSYTYANRETRIIGSINENEPKGGKEITGVMFAAGENLPLMRDKGAYNRLIVVDIGEYPPLGFAGINSKGEQSNEGLERVLLLDETRDEGCGWFGLDFFNYAINKQEELRKTFDSQLASEEIIALGHHRRVFALVMSVLSMLCKMLKIDTPNSVVAIPEYARRIITSMSYGGEHDPDVIAFEQLTNMLDASDEATEKVMGNEIKKGYFRLSGETVCFQRRLNGKMWMYVPTNTKAFKSYVGEGGMRKHGQAWLRLGLIKPTVAGKATHSVRGVNQVKVRCVLIQLQEDDDDDDQIEETENEKDDIDTYPY